MELKGKRILLVAARFFGIAEKIMQKMNEYGAVVDYYDERPDNTFFTKALIRLNRNLISGRINRYYNSIIEETAGRHYDYIFFIKGEAISAAQLKKLLDSHPESKSIVYHWDSIARNSNALNLLNCFDYRFSFDREDCMKFDLRFLPLFYYDDYAEISDVPERFEYDLLFVGTAHSGRYSIIKTIREQLSQMNKEVFSYFYFPGRIMFWKYLLQDKEARDIDRKDVHFTSISSDELLSLYRKSEAVIDINRARQSGLSLRCMEALGAKRKLVTTNADIVNYDFYSPCNILVIDRKEPVIPKEFMDSPFEPVSEEIYRKYSLTNWLDAIFQ